MKTPSLVSIALLSSLLGLSAGPGAAAPGDELQSIPKTLRRTIEAAHLRSVEVAAGEGDVEIRAGADDAVHVEVVIGPGRRGVDGFFDRVRDWFLRSRYKEDIDLVRAAEIAPEVHGDTLALDLSPNVSARHDRVHERWTIELPARLAVGLHVEVGDATITGTTSGVRARAAVGTIRIDVPSGDVDARTNVGNVKIHTRAPSIGDVLVTADVGDADLWVDGGRIEHDDAPGPGGRVALRGSSGVTIRASAQVGDASVRIR